MNVISCHSLETACLDRWPEFGKSTMNDCWILRWICYFCKELLGIYLFHRVSLSCSDELMMLSLLDLEALLVIVVDDAIYSLLIDIFAAFSSKELHDLFEWYISA